MRVATTESSVLRGALKLKPAALYLSVSPITLRRLVERGQLKANRKTRHLIFSIRELDRFLEGGGQ
jgi:hypothetical protein